MVNENKEIYNSTLESLKKQNEDLELYKNIVSNFYYSMVVVDKEGRIIILNKAYCNFLGVNEDEVIGKHCTEVIENTRMHIVAKTGKQEIGDVQHIKGNYMIADRIPIYKDGEIIGAVGTVIFKDVLDLNTYVSRISRMEKEFDLFKKELKKALGSDYTFQSIVGESESIRKVKDLSRKVAASKSNVLLLGESGTGKELFAHAIHNASSRVDYPLIKINCAAIPPDLLESELFGYEPGAFTGAKKGGKPGKFELADKSTIFLDEIGEMPLNMQAKLLRVIQEKEVERIGGITSKKIDVRIVAATNQNLEEMVKNKKFREDLYYRLNVISIKIPPLRERKEDIPVISRQLIKKLSKEMDHYVSAISTEAMNCLKLYSWPGNVRELQNVIERAFNIMDKEAMIMLEHLPYYITKNNKADTHVKEMSLKEILDNVEKEEIKKCLKRTKGNKMKTAKILGISRTSLYEKIEKYDIEV
ncbi:sigma-54 interaction domain-containing protein [Serpentinicella alkaliphila]|uniref:PAS domain S-box-containing protein n=1 Tax=Serpentinicella alkaliphila TaxID=1734049 RepID=A0A4R2TFU1_9FIRM|nr:sigma 54-interacting transcriptional regulator [Serpentinicella alkaliphila]QUH25370.1 sigma 54-interacting transcriptional regulator [Serpentinicella alkaliphila]TCQ01546.1 PAS domain S-box-containing protein [Serpentinicella alkaliphila]